MYQAPEVYLFYNSNEGYDGLLSDFWSLGIILFVMLVGAPPISANETTSKICEMSENKSIEWFDEPVPETAKDLIYQLLEVDPKKRPTANDIYKHPWMDGYDTFQTCNETDSNNNEKGKKKITKKKKYNYKKKHIIF
eukprot:33176_1